MLNKLSMKFQLLLKNKKNNKNKKKVNYRTIYQLYVNI